MKDLWALSILFCTYWFFLHSNEDQKWAEEQLKGLLKNGWDTAFDKNDLVAKEEKAKEVESTHSNSEEIKNFIGVANKKTKLEGTEPLFQSSRPIVKDPTHSVGILSTEEKTVHEEHCLVTCQEEGTYQVSFSQKRIVEIVPEIQNQVHRCLGHTEFDQERFVLKSSAEKKAKAVEQKLAKEPSLKLFSVYVEEDPNSVFKKYYLLIGSVHRDGSPNCTHSSEETTITQPASEKDFWKTDFPEDLSVVEQNPHCRLLFTQVLEGPEIRVIGNRSVFRDVWSRRLIFSCEPRGESPCTALRNQGGVLMKKKCLKENQFGECDLWEKTYDLGKQAAHQEYAHTFKEEEIWGLNTHFDSSYEKNNELMSVLSSLAIFSDLKKEFEKSETSGNHEIEIFRGEMMRCQCSFIKGILYDCCKKMDGIAVATYLATCNSEEQSLAQRRHEGRCHHIGSMKENLGTQTAQVFCCFDTKLARILHEQGRGQLGIDWGSVKEPLCRGLSLSELQRIDFTKVDFSDALDDLSINKEDLLDKVRLTVEQIQQNGQNQGQLKTGTWVQKQKEAIPYVP